MAGFAPKFVVRGAKPTPAAKAILNGGQFCGQKALVERLSKTDLSRILETAIHLAEG